VTARLLSHISALTDDALPGYLYDLTGLREHAAIRGPVRALP
jgi:hypothetical protein